MNQARELYAASIWWTTVIVTASSKAQAERYGWEIRRREEAGKIPSGVQYLVVPDVDDRRIGSGGATLNALRMAAADWQTQRVMIIHAGGDSRRLPQYSLSGKLFSAVPGDSTVFDEMLSRSTAWVQRMHAGVLVTSGDVILSFDEAALDWGRPGVSGVAMIQPVETGMRHGVYVTDETGRIYAFLQKPSRAELAATGGLLPGDRVAVDTGLLRLSPEAAMALSRLEGVEQIGTIRALDLYEHVTMGLTGQWRPAPDDPLLFHALAHALRDLPFSCSVVSGEFTHIGTTSLFRKLMTAEGPPVVDSVLSGGVNMGPGSVAIECNLSGRVRAETGSVLHGLDGIAGEVQVPADTVVHQLPVALPDGRRGEVIRVYGVEDDPKATIAGGATWFGRPILEEVRSLGIDPEKVWPGLPANEHSFWNARLFPVSTVDEAWKFARWMFGEDNGCSAGRWGELERLSLATSAQWADNGEIEAARVRRSNAQWRSMALSLVESGADIRPLLANAPGSALLADVGRALRLRGGELEGPAPGEAASRHYVAGLFLNQAGLAQEAGEAQALAYRMIERAVARGSETSARAPECWRYESVAVESPARIDPGGGWSDTPPFCLDWGGTVLNIAILPEGKYPIQATIRRIAEPLIRCVSIESGATAEYRSSEDLLPPYRPGDEFSILRAALWMAGQFDQTKTLAQALEIAGGGIEIRTAVCLPVGSGLGTSSILAATVLRALSEMMGFEPDTERLCEEVMRLEQLMTTGGGWQDQMGGIVPGAKVVVSGPGLRQRVRVQPVAWPEERQAEFEELVVLYYTGIRRIARDLLRQVVGRYLARETACVQVLHSIKTLAVEMAHAMQEGQWDRLGELLDRHRELNQVLDPNTTNTAIQALLESVRPFIRGAKLTGAGGGGFMILLARSREARRELVAFLEKRGDGGRVFEYQVAREGMRIRRS